MEICLCVCVICLWEFCVWHELKPSCAFDLPMFCPNVDLFLFPRILGKHVCPIFREGHAEFLYDFDACTHFYNQFVYYYRADVHDGQWNDCDAPNSIAH